MEGFKRKLNGHYNYYGITDNYHMLEKYIFEILKTLFKWLNRRSQKKSYDWVRFNQMIGKYNLPKPKIKVNIYEI